MSPLVLTALVLVAVVTLLVLLAFLIAVVVCVSQGSAIASTVTAAGLVAPVIEAGSYSAPMVGLVTIAIAAGATVLSHVNDSGFWLVSRVLGMDEQQTLRSWTVMETIGEDHRGWSRISRRARAECSILRAGRHRKAY